MQASRIIPARAGFTLDDLKNSSAKPDHPRSRGVYTTKRLSALTIRGSSPLARGLRLRVMTATSAVRIIPARAGFTGGLRGEHIFLKDHPRSRGVYLRSMTTRGRPRGSSPLARGLPPRRRGPERPCGIIPARAGFTLQASHDTLSQADHPRSRGVYSDPLTAAACACGSSPLARGLQRLHQKRGKR